MNILGTRFLIFLFIILVGIQWHSSANPDSPNSLRYHIIIEAKTYIGVPYKWGGKSKNGIDCVGLVNCVLNNLIQKKFEPLLTYYNMYINVSKDEMLPGDLVFFRINGKIGHIGIYMGNNEFIHSPARGQYVRIDKLEGFWGRVFTGARKLYERETMYMLHPTYKRAKTGRIDIEKWISGTYETTRGSLVLSVKKNGRITGTYDCIDGSKGHLAGKVDEEHLLVQAKWYENVSKNQIQKDGDVEFSFYSKNCFTGRWRNSPDDEWNEDWDTFIQAENE